MERTRMRVVRIRRCVILAYGIKHVTAERGRRRHALALLRVDDITPRH